MAIRQMINTRTPGEIRQFQTRMLQLGRIRTGAFETPEGKRGRPVKLGTFRFTSPDRSLIEAVAAEYGGGVEPYEPQGAGKRGQWMVDTDANRLPIYIVNGQRIDPTYEAWQAGGRCVRRCDGEWDAASARGCLCNGLALDDDGEPMRPPAPRDMCKPTTRVNVMLQAVEGLGSWLYESHGENFAMENGGVLAAFVASAPVPVPAWFCLEHETRQTRKPDGGFEKREFYVARFRITAITPSQIALGGDVISQVLTAAGAPAALTAAPQRALEAPVSAVPVSTPPVSVVPPASDDPVWANDDPQGGRKASAEEHARILAAVEHADTLDALDALRQAMIDQSIRYKRVQDAWVSKRAAVEARIAMQARSMLDDEPPVFEDEPGWRADHEPTGVPCLDPYCANHPDTACGFTPNAHLEFHGAQAILDADRAAGQAPTITNTRLTYHEPEYAVGDTVTVGGIEFVKISDNPFPPGSPAAQLFGQAEFEAAQEAALDPDPAEEADGGLPPLPDGYTPGTIAEELPQLILAAGRRTPPLTTGQVTAALCAAFGLGHAGEATGEQLARLRLAIERGDL